MIDARAVIGANYGDEGKGLATDYLAHEAITKYGRCLVVCNNGGAQRSHTVTLENGTRHIFRHFGSGTFAGADTYLSEHFILNPMTFRQEYARLSRLGYTPLVFIDKHCRVSTPYEMMLNQMLEDSRGDQRHGSCGYGIWETVQRYSEFQIWRFEDYYKFRNGSVVPEMVERKSIAGVKLHEYLASGEISDLAISEWQWIWQDPGIMQHFVDDVHFMIDHSVMTDASIISKYPAIVFENGQGLLLNSDPNNVHTTPSNTGMKNIIEMEKAFGGLFETIPYYVTRSYMTRHGAGGFLTEMRQEDVSEHIEKDLTNLTNRLQGELRYGILDHDVVGRALKDANRDIRMFVTHANELEPPDYFMDKLISETNVGGVLISNNPIRQIYTMEGK